MCGVVCILRKKDQALERADLAPLLDTLQHRGPDGQGGVIHQAVALGMTRLSVLDLHSPGLCPYVLHDPETGKPRAAIAYNGEIFNYVELREELIQSGDRFETTSDTEVLLKGYLRWGDEVLKKLNGMFAFVLADFSKNTLLLARDIAGEKPLYYYEDRDEVVVASEIKAILARTGAVELNITEEFQAFEYTTGEETLFQNIFALLPGHQMTIAGIDGDYRGALKKQYWNLDSELYEVAPERAVDLLDELLCDAVRIRLRSDVPVGLYLSGGIDSSLLACLARPSEVFSIHFAEGPKYDELRYAELIAKQINARHTIVRPTREDLHSSLSEVLYYLDQPVGSFSAFPLYMLAREASKSVKVILSGEGADELFSGYTRYLLPVFEEQAYQIPALQNYRSLVDYYLGSSLDRFSHLLNRGRVSDEVVKSVIAPHFARFPDLIHAMGYTEFKLMLVTLLHMEDRMASAFGVENRTPFLDKRIIAFAFSIPSTLKIAKMTPKFIVREVAKRYLPHEILERKEKLGLIAPINRWMNFSGVRGEFDRSSYNAMCLEQWREIFFVEKRFLRSVSRDER